MRLTEFLLARIAEDEAAARAASRARETRAGDSWETLRGRHGLDPITTPGGREIGKVIVEAGPHIARHDPARVVAECEAKRRIVDLYVAVDGEAKRAAEMGREHTATLAATIAFIDVLCALALPYADHPDYREEWKP